LIEWHEDRIIAGCLSNDKKSQELLYRKYAAALFGLCLRYCRTRAEAEDVLQDCFIKIFNNLKNYRHEGSFEGWLKRIAINTALNNYKATIKQTMMQNIDDIHEKTTIEDIEWQHNTYDAALLMQLIQNLPDGYRVVFNMYAIEGYSHKDIAQTLNISEGTSKSQLSRARKLLQSQLEEINKMSKISV